jgi:hypothetical protein
MKRSVPVPSRVPSLAEGTPRAVALQGFIPPSLHVPPFLIELPERRRSAGKRLSVHRRRAYTENRGDAGTGRDVAGNPTFFVALRGGRFQAHVQAIFIGAGRGGSIPSTCISRNRTGV